MGQKFDGPPYTQLTTPARGDLFGVMKDVSEAQPENQTKYAEVEDVLQFGSWASKVRAVTASGTVTLANTDPMFIEIDPNGSNRDVTFPAKSDDNHAYVVMHAGSANTLTLKRSGGATITTLAAGEAKYIMPSTIEDFTSLVGGAAATAVLTNSIISVTTANVTAAVRTRYIANISGLTADRNFVLPAGAVGDEIEVNISTGDDAYELIIIGDTGISINGGTAATEWSRLFITGETVRLVATSTSNWQVVYDGRKPCIGKLIRITSNTNTTHSSATEVKPDWNSAPSTENRGDIADTTNDQFLIRRAGIFNVSAGYAPANSVADQNFMQVRIYKGSTLVASSGIRQSSTGGSSVALAGIFTTPVAVAAGDTLIYYFRTEAANIGLRRSDAADGTDGQSFFAVTEIIP